MAKTLDYSREKGANKPPKARNGFASKQLSEEESNRRDLIFGLCKTVSST